MLKLLVSLGVVGLSASSALAYTPYFTSTGAMVRWWHSEIPYHWGSEGPSDFPASAMVELMGQSFAAWYQVACEETEWPEGKIPKAVYQGRKDEVRSTEPQSTSEVPDNLILFIPEPNEWLYGNQNHRSWIAITKLSYDVGSGRLVDADIEINDAFFTFTLEDETTPGTVDFMSMLVHEVGHLYALDHSDDPDATMSPTYEQGQSGIAPRTLEADDREGICAVYTGLPDGKDDGCGCQTGKLGIGLGLLGLLGMALRSRRRPLV